MTHDFTELARLQERATASDDQLVCTPNLRTVEHERNCAAGDALPDLLAVVRVLAGIIARVDAYGEPFMQSPEDAALERRARAALARFRNVEVQS